MSNKNSNKLIPIVILHRNEFKNLFKMIDSIKQNTKIPYKIFVVDNKSNDNDCVSLIEKLKKIEDIILIESLENKWVLGFNLAIKHKEWPKSSKFYVFSDADIVVPDISDKFGNCWLSYLVNEMEKNACIGKLGISLSTHDIDHKLLKNDVIAQSIRIKNNPKIGNNYIAPVDTTLAIYRNDLFVFDAFRFCVGHASLVRPHYYTCRTSDNIEAKHLGWYEQSSIKLNDNKLKEKIKCFAKYGGYIDPNILKKCGAYLSIYYKIVHSVMLLYWGFWVVFYNVIYIVGKMPRNINEIQSKCRR